MADAPVTFAGVLRELRTAAGLTQAELAEAAGLSLRALSDLERGVATTPQRETVRLLADALHLTGSVRDRFDAAARGRPVISGVAATRALPRDVASFTGRERELDPPDHTTTRRA
jgi:transcriptional regulator with XRE-family HTH domain